jgi:hypothetical protein
MTAPLLDALHAPLKPARAARGGQDVEALLRSTEAKLAALRAVEALPAAHQDPARIGALAAYNRENGLLLARRRRAVAFALRQLGRTEPVGYDPRGQRSSASWQRPIAVA